MMPIAAQILENVHPRRGLSLEIHVIPNIYDI